MFILHADEHCFVSIKDMTFQPDNNGIGMQKERGDVNITQSADFTNTRPVYERSWSDTTH